VTSTALLIMDVQRGIVDRFAGHDDGYLDRLGTAIAAARAADVMVQAEVTTIADWAVGLSAA
jgi:hypothetical protein